MLHFINWNSNLNNVKSVLKSKVIRLTDQLPVMLVMLLLLVLPSIHAEELMQGTVSGKMFFFLYTLLITVALLALKLILKPPCFVRFSFIEALLLIWIAFVLLNGIIKQMPLTGRLLEFFGLIVLYIIARQVEPKKYGILLLAMVIGGIVQAVYGNLQLWGYYPSHHNFFRITGSFFNPGPFAGYLASVFPAVLGVFLFRIRPLSAIDEKLYHAIIRVGRCVSERFKLPQQSITSCVAGIGLIVILLILIPSQSRASWVSVIVASLTLLIIRYPLIQWLKKHSLFKRIALLLLLCVMLCAGFYELFRFKNDSAVSRLLTWKITGAMIAESPITGAGFDRFKAFYMTEQAAYFEKAPDSPEAMLAGDTDYAFNEFLQHTAENGLTGLALMLSILTIAYCVTSKPFNDLAWVAKAGITGIAVFAFFSYPAHVLPVKINLTLYLACLSSLAEKKTWQVRSIKFFPVQCAFILCMSFGIFVGFNYLHIDRAARKNWNWAYRLYAAGNYSDCLSYFEKAWPILKSDGNYLTNYGKALSMADEHVQAIAVLQQAAIYYPNIVVYTALGDSYKALGKHIEAEKSYFTAWYMNPGRFFSKYLLAKLYDETGQTEKAVNTAQEILNKEVKIHSTAIDEMKKEMEEILKKYND